MLLTRREFLRASAGAGALLGIGAATGLSSCTTSSGGPIVKVAVHPAIGVARVGNSADSFYFGPEVPDALPHPPGGFKDDAGAIARQAARFRLYGTDAHGNVREVTPEDGVITWTVTLANAKATWYEFGMPFDLPIAPPQPRRNPASLGASRDQLLIAPPTRSITGPRATPVRLDRGHFLGEEVALGELMTDDAARLVFLPAAGRGYSPTGAPLAHFSDNDGWADDVGDGPVQASIFIDGREIKADPAWLVVAPPNYGPALAAGVISLYDLVRSTFVDAGWQPAGEVSLVDDVIAIFARMSDMQWTNAGYFQQHGFGSPNDYVAPAFVDRLADGSRTNADFRHQLFGQFRDPAFTQSQPTAIPDMYGDGTTIPTKNNWKWLAVTPLQYTKLRRWSDGDFVDDRGTNHPRASLGDYPAKDRPATLDRAALQACLGGPFHPGIEAPWSLREASMWDAPFRLRLRSPQASVQDYGDQLTREKALGPDGPTQGSAPGDLTRWMGVPWHSDVASCRAGYELSVSNVLPTFWAARVPNHVLREVDYNIVMDRSRSLEDRQAAFARRLDWERFIARPDRPTTLDLMMQSWFKLGIVTERPGPGDAAFPKVMKVETDLGFTVEPTQIYGPDAWYPQP